MPQHRPEIDMLRPRDVRARLGLSEATIWRLRQRGDFPAPVRLSPGRIGWRLSDITAWLNERTCEEHAP